MSKRARTQSDVDFVELLTGAVVDKTWGSAPLDVVHEFDPISGKLLKLVAFTRDNSAHDLELVTKVQPTCTLELEAVVSAAQYRAEGDASGLWLRHGGGSDTAADNNLHFVKAGVECHDDAVFIAVDAARDAQGSQVTYVATAASDFVQAAVTLRMDWRDAGIVVRYRVSSSDSGAWMEVATVPWEFASPASAGVFCASPNRKGFFAEFTRFRYGAV